MKKILDFCQEYLTGGYSVKVKKDLYVNFPRIAPVFMTAFLLVGLSDYFQIELLSYIGYGLLPIGLFGFFFYNIFPSRNKKSPLE